ncbi:MliC family protein [Methylopila sp. 73B]|uniref:MliC family protein n=1 Tax=Methylopila sp. 73B TaxID=1120792 RepID=UPI000372BCE8|nr:MliC family protein [Methylopila sp. 73B]
MRRFAKGLVALAAVAGSGCAAEAPPRPAPLAEPADPVRYACNDGSFLSVRFQGDAADVTMVDGEKALLSRLRGASSVGYAADGFELWSRGDTATWTAKGSPATACLAT